MRRTRSWLGQERWRGPGGGRLRARTEQSARVSARSDHRLVDQIALGSVDLDRVAVGDTGRSVLLDDRLATPIQKVGLACVKTYRDAIPIRPICSHHRRVADLDVPDLAQLLVAVLPDVECPLIEHAVPGDVVQSIQALVWICSQL